MKINCQKKLSNELLQDRAFTAQVIHTYVYVQGTFYTGPHYQAETFHYFHPNFADWKIQKDRERGIGAPYYPNIFLSY